jgi:UDP-hydrolysing UDP-N-acetyl-D-glucosamine 2-epimerase
MSLIDKAQAPTIDILDEFDEDEEKKRVLIWIGSRANFGRLKILIDLLMEYYIVDIITGDYVIQDSYNVIGRVPNLLYADTRANMARSVSLVTQGVITIIESRNSYDLAIVHADRFENLGFAIACSYSGIPLLHTEGGEITGQIDNKVRNAITSLADYHCTATQLSAIKLMCRGCYSSFTGSPAIDFVTSISVRKDSCDFVLALFNPSDDDNYIEFVKAVYDIASISKVFWVSPVFDPGWKKIAKKLHGIKNIFCFDKLSPQEYYEILSKARVLVGNTSSGIKEGCYLGIPYVLVGNRQGCREVGPNVKKVPCKRKDIFKAVSSIPKGVRYEYNGMFGNGNASYNILKFIKAEVFEE